MTDTQQTQAAAAAQASLEALADLQNAGLGHLPALHAAWLEAMGDMTSEVARFLSERIEEDVKTQHEILRCKTVAELQHVQARFLQKAMDQYHDETGKLVEMATDALANGSDPQSR